MKLAPLLFLKAILDHDENLVGLLNKDRRVEIFYIGVIFQPKLLNTRPYFRVILDFKVNVFDPEPSVFGAIMKHDSLDHWETLF